MTEKMTCFELCVSPVLVQNEDIWNFHDLLSLNKGKLIRYFRRSWYAIVSNFDHNDLFLLISQSIAPANRISDEYPAGWYLVRGFREFQKRNPTFTT